MLCRLLSEYCNLWTHLVNSFLLNCCSRINFTENFLVRLFCQHNGGSGTTPRAFAWCLQPPARAHY